jgi:hypothetical protein
LSQKIKSVLPVAVMRAFLVGSLLVCMAGSFFDGAMARAGDVTMITNIKEWQHPVKDVLAKHKVILYKVELHNKTYPVFYVRFPYDPWFGHNDKFFKPLYYETLKANGFWDYSFIDQSFNCKINIKWDKSTKTLSEGMDDLK